MKQTYNLDRFVKAQEQFFETALAELRQGRKQSHWMWFIFPQLKGLGYSETALYYGIENIDEAKAYMENEYLRDNLIQICQVLIDSNESNATKMFGYPDDLKLKSSMTLFAMACPEQEVFKQVLQKFFDGKMDEKSLNLL
ncbi:MAG: DUF1810 domain-containing protein [Alphaproteobacteria bacterium]|nr:DUF1810 domain-containing protein [Alphaproteobacteria bacterium]